MNTHHDVYIDASAHDCPIPMIQAKETLDTMTAGQILKLTTSKEGSVQNLKTLVSHNAEYHLIETFRQADIYTLYIQKV